MNGPEQEGVEGEEPTATGPAISLPLEAHGGQVRRTGLALLHEGEWVLPALGSEATVEVPMDTGREVHYHFPVSIEVVGEIPVEQIKDIEDKLWTRLARAVSHTS